MTNPLTVTLLLAWMAGGALGALFFGGLWWTVRAVVTAQRPALYIFASFVVRTSVAVAGLYAVSGRHLDRLLFCLLGFVMARFVVTRLLRSSKQTERPSAHEATHAP